jgi:hypothetical protein
MCRYVSQNGLRCILRFLAPRSGFRGSDQSLKLGHILLEHAMDRWSGLRDESTQASPLEVWRTTLLSEAGNTIQQVASVTGHSLKTVTSIPEKYLARTRGLSDTAIKNFENSSRTNFANQLQTSAPKGKKKNKKL